MRYMKIDVRSSTCQAYVRKRRWSVTRQKRRGYARFVIERPRMEASRS